MLHQKGHVFRRLRAVFWTAATLSMSWVSACGDSGGGGACANEDLTYSNVGKPFVGKYCASCHGASVTGPARQGAPTGYMFDSLADIKRHSMDMHDDVVVTKVMPFGSASLKPSDAERAEFGAWLECDAPE